MNGTLETVRMRFKGALRVPDGTEILIERVSHSDGLVLARTGLPARANAEEALTAIYGLARGIAHEMMLELDGTRNPRQAATFLADSIVDCVDQLRESLRKGELG